MYSIAPLDGTDAAIQWVLWTLLSIFFVMTISSWLVASKMGWFKEEEPVVDESPEVNNDNNEAVDV